PSSHDLMEGSSRFATRATPGAALRRSFSEWPAVRRKALSHLPPKATPEEGRLCGIVLAAGERTRLRHYVHRRHGKSLPKQFVNFVGRRSMLEHTFDRAERLISADHLYTVISRDHLEYPEVRRQIARRPPGTLVLQPSNRDTGPGLLLPLIRLCR